jgi:hypothetical protein
MKEKFYLLLQQLRTRKGVVILVAVLIILPLIIGIFSRNTPRTLPPKNTPGNTPVTEPTITPFLSQKEITVLKVLPGKEATEVSQTGVIEIFFAGSIPLDNTTVVLSPAVDGTYKKDNQAKKIIFTPKNGFNTITTYEAVLSITDRTFMSPDGDFVTKYSWKFTTEEQEGESGFNESEMEQFDRMQREAENAYKDRVKRLPFITSLPFKTDHFKIEISALSDDVTISTFANHPDLHETYRQEARNWIVSKGGKIDTLTIIYNP